MERRLPFILIAAGIAHFSGELSLVRCPESLRRGSGQQLPRQDRHALPRQGVELGDGAPQLRAHPLLPPGCDRVCGLGHSPRASRLRRERVARRARQPGAVSGVLSGASRTIRAPGPRAIVDSFRTAANQAAISSGGSSNLAPSDIFDTGLSIASKVADQTSLFSPASSLGLIVCALVILICFCAHRRLSRGQPCRILCGDLGRRAAHGLWRLALHQGLRGPHHDLCGERRRQAVCAAASDRARPADLPDALAKLRGQDHGHLCRGGLRHRHAGACENRPRNDPGPDQWRERSAARPLLASAAAIAGGAAALGGTAYGAGMVVRSAGRLASEQLADARLNGTAAPTAFGRGLQFTAATAGNIARAAVENIGDRLSGRAHFGTRLGQMSEELERKAAVREEERGVRQTSQSQSSP